MMDNVSMAGWPLPQYTPKHLGIICIGCPLKPLFSAMLLSRTLLQNVESSKMDEIECKDPDIDVPERLIAQMSSSLVYFEAPDCELFILLLFSWLNMRLSLSFRRCYKTRFRLPKLETLHLKLGYYCYSDPARLLSTIRRNSNTHTVILEFVFNHGVSRMMRQDTAKSITEWEDILLAWVRLIR